MRMQSIGTVLTMICMYIQRLVDLNLPGSSPHRAGFLPCCSTVDQPGECDMIYTGSSCHGKSCLRPLSQVQKEPRASDRSRTPLYCTQISNAKVGYNNMCAVKAEKIKA